MSSMRSCFMNPSNPKPEALVWCSCSGRACLGPVCMVFVKCRAVVAFALENLEVRGPLKLSTATVSDLRLHKIWGGDLNSWLSFCTVLCSKTREILILGEAPPPPPVSRFGGVGVQASIVLWIA